MTTKSVAVWENRARPQECLSTLRPLTRSSGTSREGLAMKATRTCSIDGCDKPHLARGFCAIHYMQARRAGEMVNLPEMSPAERLASELVRKPNGCLEWTGATTTHGYGHFYIDGTHFYAHRLAWTLAHGPIPAGLLVRHLVCDNPPCCDPAHLMPGTHADNTADMISKGRGKNQNSAKTHCPAGHEYAGANLYLKKNGHRVCRICNHPRKGTS
jgi:hypothetical protein